MPESAVATASRTDSFPALRMKIQGRVTTPADADWDQVRAAWNLHVDQHPAAVVQAADADDVVATVRFARSHGYSVAAQPSGHGGPRALLHRATVLQLHLGR